MSTFPGKRIGTPLGFPGMFLLLGCREERSQSALHPAGPPAEQIADLFWLLTLIGTAVFLLTMFLLWRALAFKREATEDSVLAPRFVIIWGVALPIAVLIPVLFLSLLVTRESRVVPESAPLNIRIVAHNWWWHVEYPEHDLILANEIYLPLEKTVHLELSSADVIHSFWVPNLAGKLDAMPDHPTKLQLRAARLGSFRGQCAEYCGLQHARMGLWVHVLEVADFDQWLSEKTTPRPRSMEPEIVRGAEVFFEQSCNACHRVAGTKANAKLGPDLTFIGSRTTLGAATIANNRGNLAGWITNSQALKPGNAMPPTYLSSADLHALTTYLESLQ